jgi:hypothetical protein
MLSVSELSTRNPIANTVWTYIVGVLDMLVGATMPVCALWLQTMLSVQRAFVVSVPLSAAHITFGVEYSIFVAIIVSGFVLGSVPLVVNIVQYFFPTYAIFMLTFDIVSAYVLTIHAILVYVVPPLLTASSVCVMLSSLRHQVRARQNMLSAHGGSHHALSSPEVRNTIAIMITGLLEFLLYTFFP